MLYYVLISVVILAEFIIAAEVIGQLIKWNKIFKEANLFLDEVKPKIKDIAQICLKISEQLKELAPIWVDKFKITVFNMAVSNLKNMLIGIGIWAIRQSLKKD